MEIDKEELVKLSEKAGFVVVDGEIFSPTISDLPITDEVEKLLKLALKEANLATVFEDALKYRASLKAELQKKLGL